MMHWTKQRRIWHLYCYRSSLLQATVNTEHTLLQHICIRTYLSWRHKECMLEFARLKNSLQLTPPRQAGTCRLHRHSVPTIGFLLVSMHLVCTRADRSVACPTPCKLVPPHVSCTTHETVPFRTISTPNRYQSAIASLSAREHIHTSPHTQQVGFSDSPPACTGPPVAHDSKRDRLTSAG